MIILPGQQLAGRSENDDRLVLLIFRRRYHLLLGQVERDAVALVRDAAKMQCIPVDDDLAAADAEEAAEIDHSGPNHAGAVDDDVNDTAHVLISCAAYLPAEHAMGILR